MALQFQTTLPTKATADYLRINNVAIDYSLGVVTGLMLLYVSKEARDSKATPIDTIHFALPITNIPEIRDAVYAQLKQPSDDPVFALPDLRKLDPNPESMNPLTTAVDA